MKLSFVRVRRWDEALDLLNVRNQCREGMTHTTSLITEEDQAKFFAYEIVPGHTYECYLLRDGAVAAGYGLLKRDGNRKWMTAGLARPYRAKHLSRLLIALITEVAYADPGTEVWIDVYDDNLALIGDIKVGYEFVDSQEVNGRTLHIMKHRRNRPLPPREAHRLGQTSGIVEEMIAVDEITREFMRK